MPVTAPSATPPDFVLVMGVCGVGKSTIARQIAELSGGRLVEADDHHPPDNIRTMAAGTPLTDDLRWPWLAAVATAAQEERASRGGPVLIACSALKRRYRDFLRRQLGPLPILHLSGDPDLIRRRLEERRSHFMPPRLLDSQLAELEAPGPDEAGIAVDISESPQRLVAKACERLGLAGNGRVNRPDEWEGKHEDHRGPASDDHRVDDGRHPRGDGDPRLRQRGRTLRPE